MVTNGIIVDAGAGGTTTISNDISGTGALAQDGCGTLVLSGNNSYSGGTTIGAAGAVQLSGTGDQLGTGTASNSGSLLIAGRRRDQPSVPDRGPGEPRPAAGRRALSLANTSDYIAALVVNGSLTLDTDLSVGTVTLVSGSIGPPRR